MSMTGAYFGLLALCWWLDTTTNNNLKMVQTRRNFFLTAHFIFAIYIGLMLGLRHEAVGPDTRSYIISFKEIKYTSFFEIFNADDRSKEYLFSAVSKLISMCTDNRFVFTTLFGMFFSLSYGYLVHKISDNYVISYAVLFFLYMNFVISGMRQVAAMSVLFLSYKFIKERRLIPFLLCIAVAYYFHNTSIIFVAAYFVNNKKMGPFQLLIIGAALFMTYILPSTTNKLLYNVIAWEKLAVYEVYDKKESVNSTGFLIKLCLFIFNVFHYKQVVNKNKNNAFLYNMSAIGVAMEAFTVIMSQAFRMSMYFSIFDTILLANVLQGLDARGKRNYNNKMIAYIFTAAIFILYYFVISTPIVYRMGIG